MKPASKIRRAFDLRCFYTPIRHVEGDQLLQDVYLLWSGLRYSQFSNTGLGLAGATNEEIMEAIIGDFVIVGNHSLTPELLDVFEIKHFVDLELHRHATYSDIGARSLSVGTGIYGVFIQDNICFADSLKPLLPTGTPDEQMDFAQREVEKILAWARGVAS